MLYTSGKIIAITAIVYYTTSHHVWVSFEATAEVCNEVCRDGCINNVTKLKRFLKMHPVITKNTDHGMNKPILYVYR